MCGISGYIGTSQAAPIVLECLKKLEYRGYDSAGIATLGGGKINVCKTEGKLDNLISKSRNGALCRGTLGIGHTRWATHGEASQINAHPHCTTRFALVHNGIIKNYSELKKEYLDGITLSSDTDSEVIVQLIELFTNSGESVMSAISHFMELAEGSWAIALIDKNSPEIIYVAKNKSPLLIGAGTDFNLIASDALAMSEHTKVLYEICDMEIAEISSFGINVYDTKGNKVNRTPYVSTAEEEDTELGDYPHYMLKEIEQQSAVIKKVVNKYCVSGSFDIPDSVISALVSCDKVCIVACGSSYHAGLIGKYYFEKIASKPADAYIASEFIYSRPILSENPVFIFVSQSGETADCITAMSEIKKKGYPAFCVTNVIGSTLAKMSDYSFQLYAGAEISVASTKAYTAQLAVFAVAASSVVKNRGVFRELAVVSEIMEDMYTKKEEYKKIAEEYLSGKVSCFYIGRGVDSYTSMEAALKLKEISYIHAEALAAGELKHGTIALIEPGTPVFAVNTQSHTDNCVKSNIKEAEARGASIVSICPKEADCDEAAIIIESINELYMPFLSIVPAQYIAYYTALQNDCDVDKPRNLAKSVTVE